MCPTNHKYNKYPFFVGKIHPLALNSPYLLCLDQSAAAWRYAFNIIVLFIQPSALAFWPFSCSGKIRIIKLYLLTGVVMA